MYDVIMVYMHMQNLLTVQKLTPFIATLMDALAW
jgi:hypothetical protein